MNTSTKTASDKEVRHFLTLTDLSSDEFRQIIERAIVLKSMQHRGEIFEPLKNKVLAMIFEKSSTRTRVSFESGMAQFGGHAIFLSPRDTQLGRGEPVEDSARVLSSMADCLMVRTFEHDKAELLAEYSSVPVINGLTDDVHPCQLLADMQTWFEHRGDIKGKKVGVVGLGGLGHMGVKFARAFGAHVVVFTTSPNKKEDAVRLGAHEVIISTNPEEMQKHAGSFDFILDTISAEHDINAYINMLGLEGNITLVGAPEKPLAVSAFALIFGRKSVSGSLIGGIKETQEMLDFCGGHNITADVEVIPIQKVNEAYERMLKSDVKYRFSIDMASLKAE